METLDYFLCILIDDFRFLIQIYQNCSNTPVTRVIELQQLNAQTAYKFELEYFRFEIQS